MNQESRIKEQDTETRRMYTTPYLIHYGAVRILTRAGAGSKPENNLWMIFCENVPTKIRQCSERRVKENIVRIGDHPLGFGLYLFDYRPEYRGQWGQGRQFGVMIDEVERVMPEAVSMHPDGYKRVDHSLLGIHQYAH